jgi:hypothetical protein
MKSSLIRKVVIGTFLSVPAISSIISTIHLIDLFNLGNPTWLSILLAVTFELGSIASLLAISVIERIKVGAIWFIFFILSALQIIGNVYYSYSFTSDQLLSNPTFLTNFMDLFSFITGDEMKDVKIFLSCIIGIPIPLIALFFLKSNIDYLKPDKTKKEEPKQVEPKDEEDRTEQVVQTKRKPKSQPIASVEAPKEEPQHDDPTMDDHVILNPKSAEEPSLSNEEEEQPMHFDAVEAQEQQDEATAESGKHRSPKPMISQRRNESISVLHRK